MTAAEVRRQIAAQREAALRELRGDVRDLRGRGWHAPRVVVGELEAVPVRDGERTHDPVDIDLSAAELRRHLDWARGQGADALILQSRVYIRESFDPEVEIPTDIDVAVEIPIAATAAN